MHVRALILFALVTVGCSEAYPVDDGRIDRSQQTWVWCWSDHWTPHVRDAVQWWADRGYVTAGEWQDGQPNATIRLYVAHGEPPPSDAKSTWDGDSARVDVYWRALRNYDNGAYFTEVVKRELGNIFGAPYSP